MEGEAQVCRSRFLLWQRTWLVQRKPYPTISFPLCILTPPLQSPASPKDQAPPTYLEFKRKEAQQHYKEEMKYINDNKEELERLLAQDQQMMNAQVPGTLLEAMDQILGNAPPPPVPGAPVPAGTTPPSPTAAASSSQASPPASSAKA